MEDSRGPSVIQLTLSTLKSLERQYKSLSREGSFRDIKQNGIWMETWRPNLETFFYWVQIGGGEKKQTQQLCCKC